MLDDLLTEQPNPASLDIDRLAAEEILRIMNAEDRKVAAAVAAEIPQIALAVDAVVERIRRGGRLFYIGAGTSGRLGVLDAAECRPTFNVAADLVQGIIAGGEKALSRATEASEDDAEAGARDLRKSGFNASDALAGIAASGRTPYVVGAVEAARGMGALTIGISCTRDSRLSQAAAIAITPLTGPEVIAGSTRLKAGTATKMVLNMLSTAVMIRLGYLYGNLMVNVQPANEKLRDRARLIVAQAAGVDRDAAARWLEAAGNDVRTAIVMARRGLSRQGAEELLARHGGRVGEALAEGEGAS